MSKDDRLTSPQFPRSSEYNPEWVVANASGGANALWLTEWLTNDLRLTAGMRVLDLGCGRAASSIFLRREFGVQVWAADLWFSVAENIQRVRDVGMDDGIFPVHVDARDLPFAPEFFDVILAIDSFLYFGTDELYLNDLTRFVKPGGTLAISGAGLVHEFEGSVPRALERWWTQDCLSLHSAAWWRHHWERTGLVDIELADTMPGGWQRWLEWHRTVCPDNTAEIEALEADRGEHLGYVRMVARRRPDAVLAEPVKSIPTQYTKKPLLRRDRTIE